MLVPKLDLKRFSILDKIEYSIITENATGKEYKLEMVDTLFLRCIDGSKNITQINEDLRKLLSCDIANEIVWKALDALSDIGILKSQLAPPSGGQKTSRRRFLSTLVGTMAIGSTVAPAVALAQSTEQSDKRQAEQEAKRNAEQNAKSAQEQSQKGSSDEQQQKSSEQDTKSAQEENQKQRQAEQEAKRNAEQNAKSAREQSQKGSSDEQQQKANSEVSQKELQVKVANAGGGNPDPVSVDSPTTLPLLALGATTMALLKLRNKRLKTKSDSGENMRDSES